MNHETKQAARASPLASGLLLVAIATVLVALALTANGAHRIGSIVALGVMIPVVAAGARATGRSTSRSQISRLEEELEDERVGKRTMERRLARFTDEMRALVLAASSLATRLNVAGDGETDNMRELLGALSRDAVDLVRMTGNLAATAQFNAGTHQPRQSVVSLDHQTERAVAMLRHGSLEISVDTNETSVWGDPMTIRIALLDILHTATDGGATRARVDVAERNGIGILSIADDRPRHQHVNVRAGGVLDEEGSLSRTIVPALVESQGGTVAATRTLGWSTTIIRLPVATPAQLAGSMGASGSLREPTRFA